MDCVFCKVINRQLPGAVIYEDEKVIAFDDIEQVAPFHILIVPKRHIPSVDHLNSQDKELIGDLLLTAQQIARTHGIDKTGYRLIFNVGRDAGQTVEHLHLHLLGGKKFSWP